MLFRKKEPTIKAIAKLASNLDYDFKKFPHDKNNEITPLYQKLIETLIPFCKPNHIQGYKKYINGRCSFNEIYIYFLRIKPENKNIVLPANVINKITWLKAFIDSPEFEYWYKLPETVDGIKNTLNECISFLTQTDSDAARREDLLTKSKLQHWANQFKDLKKEVN